MCCVFVFIECVLWFDVFVFASARAFAASRIDFFFECCGVLYIVVLSYE